MYERIDRLRERCHIDHYPICIEKFRITLDVLEEHKNESTIIKRARMIEAYVDRMPISIGEDELIVGIGSSKPMALEIDPSYGIWTQDEIDSLNRLVSIFLESAELRVKLHKTLTLDYWRNNVEALLTFQDKSVLNGSGSLSNKQAEDFVKKVYDDFNAKRKKFEAFVSDQEDLQILEDLEKEISGR